jgi:Tfp pilus assembly protein PilN
MIEINLLPDELKAKAKNSRKEQDLARLLYFLPALAGIVLLAHLWLAGLLILKSYQLNSLAAKWKSLEPQRKMVEQARLDYDILSQDSRIAQQLSVGRASWAIKLNQLSLDLSPGVWFNDLEFSSKECVLKGSVISLAKEEMTLVNKFLDNLKKDALFFTGLSNPELSAVQMRTVGGYNVVDFTLLFKPKSAGANK